MSSLLKALKQQQSPLLSQRSALDASLMAEDKGSRGWVWLLWPAVLILGVVLGSATARWGVVEDNPEADLAARFSWGETANIEPVEWEAEPEPLPPEELQPVKAEEVTADNIPPERSGNRAVNQTGGTEVQREALDLTKVSPDLLKRFEAAVSDTSSSGGDTPDSSVIPPLNKLSAAFQQQVPAFSYDSHMYRSSATERWIELNGQRLYEGDSLGALTVLRIDPQRVVLVMDSQAFSQTALENWQL